MVILVGGGGEGGGEDLTTLPIAGSPWWSESEQKWKITYYTPSTGYVTTDYTWVEPEYGAGSVPVPPTPPSYPPMTDQEAWDTYATEEEKFNWAKAQRAARLIGGFGALAALPMLAALIPPKIPEGTKKNPITKDQLRAWESSQKARTDTLEKMSTMVQRLGGVIAENPILLAPVIYWLIEVGENYPRASYDNTGKMIKPRGIYSGEFGDRLQLGVTGITSLMAAKEVRDWLV